MPFYITVRVLPKRPNHIHLCKVLAILCYLMRRFHKLTTSEEYTKLTAPAKNYTGLCNKTEYPRLFAPVTAQNYPLFNHSENSCKSPLALINIICLAYRPSGIRIIFYCLSFPVSDNVPRSPAASYIIHHF